MQKDMKIIWDKKSVINGYKKTLFCIVTLYVPYYYGLKCKMSPQADVMKYLVPTW